MLQTIAMHQLTDPQILEIHELLKLKEEILACEDLIASANRPVAGLQIIPQQQVDAATARLEVIESKLAAALLNSSETVKERFKGVVAYVPPAE